MALIKRTRPAHIYSAPFPVLGALLSLLFLVLSIGAVAYFVSVAAERENKVAYEESRHIVATAFSLKEQGLRTWVRDYAWWDDTLKHATTNVDLDWAENNIGTYVQDSLGLTGSFVTSPDFKTVFYSPRENTIHRDALEFLGKNGLAFLKRAQATTMESSTGLTTYVRYGGSLYLVGAAPITKERPTVDDLIPHPRPILIMYKKLNNDVIAEMSEQFLLNGLRLDYVLPSDTVSYELPNIYKQPVAYAAWFPSMPGDELFSELLPRISMISAMLFLTALLIFFAWWRTASQANIEKSRFLAKMSHELRTPLNPIVGFSSMMANETLGPIPETYKSYAGDIHRCGLHLSGVIQDILDVSRIEAGEMTLTESNFDVTELIDEIPALVGNMLPSKDSAARNSQILKVVDEKVPMLRGDKLRVQQVLVNLVSNAVKFSDGKDIIIRAGNQDGCIVVSVEDQGIGISEKDLKLLFQPFVQVGKQTIENRSHGSGLGLAVSRELMLLHGGSLVLHSKPGHGTTAVMRFPASRSLA